MKYTIEFADDPPHVTVTTSGTAQAVEIISCLEQIVSDPRFRTRMTVLLDNSVLDPSSLSVADLHAIARFTVSLGDRLKHAVFAHVISTSLGFGLTRMYHALADQAASGPSRVFRTREEAIAWLADVDRRGR